MSKNVIVNTGCANLSSVKFAVQRLGFDVEITDDHQTIKNAARVILPGVGSAQHAMKNISAKGLVPVLQQLTQPVLGFCLGMQLMTESSAETGNVTELAINKGALNTVACLSLIPTRVEPLKADGLRLPHMGWNTLTNIQPHPIFKGINEQDYVYFVHGYGAPVSPYTIATTTYGQAFSAAIAKDNFIGCQFHPERSSHVGSRIIKNFMELSL